MKKQTTKLVGVCAAALLTIGAVTPATATIFGDNGVASAAQEITGNYLQSSINVEPGSFSQDDLELLADNGQTKLPDFDGTGILSKLFPGAFQAGVTNPAFAFGLSLDTAATDYTVTIKSDLPNDLTLNALNQRTTPINITLQLAKGNVNIAQFKSVINFNTFKTTANDISGVLGTEYKIQDGVSVVAPDGTEYEYDSANPAAKGNTYFDIKDISNPAFEDEYTDDANIFNKLTPAGGFKQKLQVVYYNTLGVKVTDIVERTIIVNATEETTPVLYFNENNLPAGVPTNGDVVYFTNGATIPSIYAFETYSLNTQPPGGVEAWITDNVFGGFIGAAGDVQATIKNTTNTTGTLDAFAGTRLTPANEYWEKAIDGEDASIDASGVDLTKVGEYTYKLTVKNAAGVSATFTLPLVVKQSDNAPVYKYELGQSQNMTIKVGESFNPYEGISFWQNDKAMQGAKPADKIPTEQVKIDGAVNTNKAGVYTLTYTATNKIGKTVTVTRTITVTDGTVQKDIPVYRLYNAGNGHHMFTKSFDEYTWLKTQGWTQEGMAWESPAEGNPVYRLYNATTGEHLFTMDIGEYNWLATQGWTQEGVSFYSAPAATGNPVYRLYNPITGLHFYTQSEKEYNWLPSQGWKQEGPAFYGVGK